jgi:TRAP-type uncharacterized transport system fused permease subunit
VCLAAFSAAGVAGSKPMKTGFTAWKLAKGLYIIPFLFAYTPILFEGPVIEVFITALSALIGLFGFTVTWEGFILRKMYIWERVVVGLGTIFLFWPDDLVKLLGLIIVMGIYLFQRIGLKRQVHEVKA